MKKTFFFCASSKEFKGGPKMFLGEGGGTSHQVVGEGTGFGYNFSKKVFLKANSLFP